MTNTGNESENKPVTANDVGEESRVYEDEINLMDYFLVLWKHKWFILVCSVLPALIVWVCIYLSPSNYVSTYTYDVRDWNLNEKNYNIMLSRFYSEENLNKLADKMQKSGLDAYAEQVRGYVAGSQGFVEFEADPAFFDLSKLNVTDQTQLQEILNAQASLLNMTITGKPKGDMQKISSVIRDNIENVIPLYTIQDQLAAAVRSYKKSQSGIESGRFTSKLTLKQNRDVLVGLKNIEPRPVDNAESNITLRYDIESQSQYLPLSYQVQAVESKVVGQEQQIVTTEAKYNYYTDLVSLNERFLAGLSDKISGDYSISQFRSFLVSLSNDIEKKELKDYLSSYIINIENRMSASGPVTQRPEVSGIARGTLKKSVIVLMVASMLSVFAAFILEALKKSGSDFLEK